MKDFGFNISVGRTENLDTLKRNKIDELMDRVPSYRYCISCGTCTAVCSAGQFTNYNFRRVHTAFSRGETEKLEESLRSCMLCGKCTLACPRGVNTRALIVNMRRILHG